MRIRTIGAMLALLLLSLFVHHIRTLSAMDDLSTNVAAVTVDGVPQSVTVALPTSMLSHVPAV
ncbi:MAG: hypothetical protein ACYDCQ_07725, partial [Dehalococcoidia bacterium]